MLELIQIFINVGSVDLWAEQRWPGNLTQMIQYNKGTICQNISNTTVSVHSDGNDCMMNGWPELMRSNTATAQLVSISEATIS